MIPEIEATQERLEQLCRQYGVERLEVFGSAVSGRFAADSDIDLVVEFLLEATGPGYFARFFDLLESSNLSTAAKWTWWSALRSGIPSSVKQ